MKKRGLNGYGKRPDKLINIKKNRYFTFNALVSIFTGICAIISFFSVISLENVNIVGNLKTQNSAVNISITNESNRYLNSLDYEITFITLYEVYDLSENKLVFKSLLRINPITKKIEDQGNTTGNLVNLEYDLSSNSRLFKKKFTVNNKSYEIRLSDNDSICLISIFYKKIPVFPNPFQGRIIEQYQVLKTGRRFISLSKKEVNDLLYYSHSYDDPIIDIEENGINAWSMTLDTLKYLYENEGMNTSIFSDKELQNLLVKCFNI